MTGTEDKVKLRETDRIWKVVEDLEGLASMLLVMSEVNAPEINLFLVHSLEHMAARLKDIAGELEAAEQKSKTENLSDQSVQLIVDP